MLNERGVADDIHLRQYYPLRVRTLTLLVEAVDFPACTDDASRKQHAEQFMTLDTLIDNLHVSSLTNA
jgi:hypothetical protein